MFLSKLFKHTRARVITALAGMAMIVGAGAAISSGVSAVQNEVTETKAATVSYDGTKYIYLKCDNGSGNYWDPNAGKYWLYYWNGGTNGSVTMSRLGSSDYYGVAVPSGSWSNFIFSRTSGSASSWNQKVGDWDYTKTADLTAQDLSSKNLAHPTSYGSSSTGASTDWSYWNAPATDPTKHYLQGNEIFMSDVGTTGTKFKWNSALKMDDATGGNAAYKLVHLSVDSEFRGISFVDATDTWRTMNISAGTTGLTKSGNNIKVSSGGAGYYHVYLSNSTWQMYVSNAVATITYKYVVDGVLQDKASDGTALPDGTYNDVPYGQIYGDLVEPTFYGASFDGWYTSSTLDTAISENDAILGDRTIYAKFTSDPSGKTIYADIPSTYYSSLLDSNYLYLKYWNGTTSSMVKLKEYTSISIDGNKFYRANIPSDATGFLFTRSGGSYAGGDSYKQTIDFAIGAGETPRYNNGKNLIVVGGGGGSTKQSGSWTDIRFFLEVGTSNSVDAEGGYTSIKATHDMSTPEDASSGDLCKIMGVSLTSGDYVHIKYVVFYSGNTVTKFHNIANGWDKETDSSKWTYIENVANGVHMKKNAQVNIYVVGSGAEYGRMYFVDCSGVEGAGYLYISTQLLPAQIRINCIVNSVTVFSGSKLSTVTDVESASNLGFGGIEGIIKVPFYNLKKSAPVSGDTFDITLTSSLDGAKHVDISRITFPTEATYSGIITLNNSLGSWSNPVTPTTTAALVNSADVGLDIAKAISSASNSSVCNVEKSTAETLCYLYENTAGVKATLSSDGLSYYVDTWDGSKTTTHGSPVYSGSEKAGFTDIRYELGMIAGGTYTPSARFIPGAVGTQSPLTTTLWIVLGAGLAGLVAIGTAYFVSKKKKRYQA